MVVVARDSRGLHADWPPEDLTLETSSRCNLRCVMCPHAVGAVERPGHFPDELVDRLGSALSQARRIQLHGIGEATLNPAFWRMLDRLPTNTRASVNTNLAFRNDPLVRRLATSRLSHVSVSLDAGTPETYRAIRGWDFEQVVANIRLLVAEKSKRLVVSLNMTMMRRNVQEVSRLVQLAHDTGANVVQVWHLNRLPVAEMSIWKVEREGWTFDYSQEGLWDRIIETREVLADAEALAQRLGVKLKLDHNRDI
ncbi:radical SAM protein [Thalassobaculum sp.]|uniref:radical SAM protein n=1 Tax=Thalassobaculum sp. TaxID=2022740 RepID=UPI0032EBEA38